MNDNTRHSRNQSVISSQSLTGHHELRGAESSAILACSPGGPGQGGRIVQVKRGRASVIDPSWPRDEQIAELSQAIKDCYCGLGPAYEIWRKMTPEKRAACSCDKPAYAQLLWKHGVTR